MVKNPPSNAGDEVSIPGPYMTTGKTIALTRRTFVGKVMSLLLNVLSRFITFLPRSKRLLISWLQSPSAMILEPRKIKSDTVSPSISHVVRQGQPTSVLLPGKSHGWRSLVGCSPWGRKESDTTEQLHFHVPLSCIGEGNGNPLQCSCLENLRDGGACWAAVSGVIQSWTRLKRFISSSNNTEPG